jgi:nucleoside-diphosphate-sugar epimerase
MRILITGGTGLIGSRVLDLLLADGHQVTALVRSDASAKTVAAKGAMPLPGDMADPRILGPALAQANAFLHLASPRAREGGRAEANAAVFDTVIDAWAGSDRHFVHTGGMWIYGSGPDLTEDSPLNPPAHTAWRVPLEQAALAAGVPTTVVIAPGIVYGHGNGLPGIILNAARNPDGTLPLIGDGHQHWATVHVDDLPALYASPSPKALSDTSSPPTTTGSPLPN